jgi:hypothetical protein
MRELMFSVEDEEKGALSSGDSIRISVYGRHTWRDYNTPCRGQRPESPPVQPPKMSPLAPCFAGSGASTNRQPDTSPIRKQRCRLSSWRG